MSEPISDDMVIQAALRTHVMSCSPESWDNDDNPIEYSVRFDGQVDRVFVNLGTILAVQTELDAANEISDAEKQEHDHDHNAHNCGGCDEMFNAGVEAEQNNPGLHKLEAALKELQ